MPVYNFSAGPAMLPKKVMEKAQAEFCNYQNSECGVMELSHRGKLYAPIIARAEANVRELMNISDDYAVLFIQGGASMQFCMLAMTSSTATPLIMLIPVSGQARLPKKLNFSVMSISAAPAKKPNMIIFPLSIPGTSPTMPLICTSPATIPLQVLSTALSPKSTFP